MANNNINSEKIEIKKRYTVGLVISLVLLGIGTLVAGTSVFGFISAFASVVAGLSMIGTGIATFLFARSRKRNRLAALSQKEEAQEVKKEENVEKVERVKEKEVVQKKEVVNEAQKTTRRDDKQVREENRTDAVAPNTFAVMEEDGKTIFTDANGHAMIYKINEKNDRDVRRIIPSITGNELKQTEKFVISIYNNKCEELTIPVSKDSYEKDLINVYSNIDNVRRECVNEQVKEATM